jgi:hypothetical protein
MAAGVTTDDLLKAFPEITSPRRTVGAQVQLRVRSDGVAGL